MPKEIWNRLPRMHFCPRVSKILLWKAKARLIQTGLKKKNSVVMTYYWSSSIGTIPEVPVTESY